VTDYVSLLYTAAKVPTVTTGKLVLLSLACIPKHEQMKQCKNESVVFFSGIVTYSIPQALLVSAVSLATRSLSVRRALFVWALPWASGAPQNFVVPL